MSGSSVSARRIAVSVLTEHHALGAVWRCDRNEGVRARRGPSARVPLAVLPRARSRASSGSGVSEGRSDSRGAVELSTSPPAGYAPS